MLTELRIADLGVIAEAEVAPGPGFTAITGETGAGKTMVVTGLSLLLGARADAGLVRRGAERCLVEGRWSVDSKAAQALAEAGAQTEDGEVLVSRQITASRSRAFVGGAAVPVSRAADTVAQWATIHGQSEQVRLGTGERQREVLDRFAGSEVATLLADYAAWYAERRRAAAELAELTTRAQERARELDLLRFGLDEIARADPQPGEDDTLAAEAERLQSIDDLRLAAHDAAVALAGDDDAWDDAPTAMGLVAKARRSLDGAAGHDPALRALAEQVAEVGHLLADAAAEVSSYLAGLDGDPARLEWIAGRRAELQHLTRKYGSTVAEVLDWARTSAARVEELAGSDDRIATIGAQLASLDRRLAVAAERLGGLRREAAGRLTDLVHAELAALAMPHARLEFVITPLPDLGPHGGDQVALLFAANPGAALGPLGRVASGGELSRVRLALEVVLAAGASGQTFVFDEVDAGVGGAVALEIGRRLARLAQYAQVIVVTHLAQVAAFADRHFVVAKATDGRVTTSGITEVTGDGRLDELARMMAGLGASSSAQSHAAELLAEASRGVVAGPRPSKV